MKTLVLYPDQVWCERGCFYVGLKPDGKYGRLAAYKDAFGQRVAIIGGHHE